MKKLLVNSHWSLVICFVAMILFSFNANASDASSEFQKANELYQKQNYDSAIKIYEQLISQDYLSAEVFYNLGNCYYKRDSVGKSILNYERALKLKPDDEDINFNLKVAQLKVVDKIEAVPEIFYRRWIKSLSSMFTMDGWSHFILVCVWLLFLSAAVYVVSSRSSMKPMGFLLATFFLIIGSCGWFLAQQSYADHVSSKSAVVMNVTAYVKSSPGDSNTDLFLLHEGTKVEVIDEYENWVKIKIANGSVGWLKMAEIEQI